MLPDDPSLFERLFTRLRRAAISSSVPGSLPVLFFGDVFSAQVATVGLNPSLREYLDRNRQELDGPQRRFETLRSVGAVDRESLTREQCLEAIDTMRGYFQPGKPVYDWFRRPEQVLQGMGFSYTSGQVAHLDLVQEATDPTWSALLTAKPEEAQAIRDLDSPFLSWEIETFPPRLVICNGKTVLNEVCGLTGARRLDEGKLARITWWVAAARVSGRSIGIVGWNIPLARATGLGTAGERELGRLLIERVREHGLG